MTITNYYDKLVEAGLPVISASDDGVVTWSRVLTEDEYYRFLEITDPEGQPARDRFLNAKSELLQVQDFATWSRGAAHAWYVEHIVGPLNTSIPATISANTNRAILLTLIPVIRNLGLMIWAAIQIIITLRNREWQDVQDE